VVMTASSVMAASKPITLKAILNTVKDQKSTVAPTSNPVANVKPDLIVGINVSGNVTISASFIKDNSLLHIGDEISPFRIGRAVKNVQSLGIFASVKTEVSKTASGKVVTIIVRENPVIRSIQFKGATAFSQSELEGAIQSKSNEIANLGQVRRDLKLLEKFYADHGYERARIVSFEPPLTAGDPLVFNVAEGVLEDIQITGNTKTRDYVILREMDTKLGDPIQNQRLISDLRRVYNLGYFTSVVPELADGVSANGQVLRLGIEERDSNGTFTLGGGFSPTAGFSFFSDVYWDNLFGTGQLVSVKAQLGRSSTYQFKYFNPWAWDKRKSFTFRTWLRDGQVDQFLPNSSSVGYRSEKSKGVEFGIGWPFTYELVSNHSVKYESVQLVDVNKSYTVNSYSFSLSYDTRDVRFNPLNGMFHTLSIEKAFWFNSRSLDFTRIDLDLRQFFKIADQQTIATRIALGYLTGPKIGDQDLFLREFYRVGGSNSVRGWNDFYPFGIGNKQAIASIEYRYVFNDLLQAVVFVDAGTATSGRIDLSQARIGKGVGVRFNVPALGPIRLDWAFNDEGDSFVHVSVGHSF